jgi:hypothetical protein
MGGWGQILTRRLEVYSFDARVPYYNELFRGHHECNKECLHCRGLVPSMIWAWFRALIGSLLVTALTIRDNRP